MLDKGDKKKQTDNSQTKIHADTYNIMKPGLYLWRKKNEGGQTDKQKAHMLNSSSGHRRDTDNRHLSVSQ